jgi:hypothetical protein
VETRHENEGCLGQAADKFRPHGDNLTDPGADRKILVAFALNRTGMATDTFFGILEKVILAHGFPPDRMG